MLADDISVPDPETLLFRVLERSRVERKKIYRISAIAWKEDSSVYSDVGLDVLVLVEGKFGSGLKSGTLWVVYACFDSSLEEIIDIRTFKDSYIQAKSLLSVYSRHATPDQLDSINATHFSCYSRPRSKRRPDHDNYDDHDEKVAFY